MLRKPWVLLDIVRHLDTLLVLAKVSEHIWDQMVSRSAFLMSCLLLHVITSHPPPWLWFPCWSFSHCSFWRWSTTSHSSPASLICLPALVTSQFLWQPHSSCGPCTSTFKFHCRTQQKSENWEKLQAELWTFWCCLCKKSQYEPRCTSCLLQFDSVCESANPNSAWIKGWVYFHYRAIFSSL